MTPTELRAAGNALNLGPVALAREMGVPYDTLKNWLSGRRPIPPIAERCLELIATKKHCPEIQ